jgi:uncharacterized protein (DUF58 family)
MKWIVGTLILLLIGFVLQLSLLVYSMYVLGGILFVTRTLSAIWIKGLQCSRQIHQTEAEIGDIVKISVKLKNIHPFNIPWVLFEEEGPKDDLICTPVKLQLKGPRLGIERFKSGAIKFWTYEATMKARGYYVFGPAQVETGDVFGLHRKHRTFGKRDGVLVLPKVVPILRNQWVSNRALGETRITHRLFEDPARFSGIRPYQAGDPLNRIHWRATARAGELQTRMFDPSCIQGATLVVDFHASSFGGGKDHGEAELLVTTTASLAHAFDEAGEQIGLVALAGNKAERIQQEDREALKRLYRPWFSSQPREKRQLEQSIIVPTRKGGGQLQVIKEALAKMEFAGDAMFDEWIIEYKNWLPRDASVIVLAHELTSALIQGIVTLKASGYRVSMVQVNWQSELKPDWAAPSEERAELAATGVPCFHVRQEEDIAWLGSDLLI